MRWPTTHPLRTSRRSATNRERRTRRRHRSKRLLPHAPTSARRERLAPPVLGVRPYREGRRPRVGVPELRAAAARALRLTLAVARRDRPALGSLAIPRR